jgi:hypothetical protein
VHVFSRVNLAFGTVIMVFAGACALLLALGTGPQPSDALIPLVGGAMIAASGWVGRDPRRIQSVWLIGVLGAAGVMLICSRGFSGIMGSDFQGARWWAIAQGVLFVVCAVYLVVLARITFQQGRRVAAEAEAQRQAKAQPSRRSKRR